MRVLHRWCMPIRVKIEMVYRFQIQLTESIDHSRSNEAWKWERAILLVLNGGVGCSRAA
jgi:hypothetical protein